MPITATKDGTIIAEGKDGVNTYRILAMKHALRLETIGLRGRANVYQMVKQEFGFKGSKKKVLEQLEQWIADNMTPNQ